MNDCVNLKISSCNECSSMKADRYYTGDSFEICYEWVCKAAGCKRIAIQDWNGKEPKIPAWCPLR